MANNVVSLNERNGLPRSMTEEEALALIRELVSEGGRVVFDPHAFDRMEERDITTTQVFHVLKRGALTRGPTWSVKYSNWAMTLRADAAGQYVGVGVAVDTDLMGLSVLVITAFC